MLLKHICQGSFSSLSFLSAPIKCRIYIITFFLCLVTPAFAGLTINGITPAYDILTNTYLFSIDPSLLGTSMQAKVEFTEASVSNLTIDGNATDGNYIFQDVGGDKKYTIETFSNGEQQTCYLQFTALPIMSIQGGYVCYVYTETQMVLQEKGKSPEVMKAKIKWRGATTNSDDKHKRNYSIKFIDDSGNKKDYSFFGLRKDNHWILDAGQVDMFRMRNQLMAQLWLDFAHKPYYSEQEPKALTASRGHIVEVFRDDQYQGIYNLCEPIDRKQMKLKKFEEDGTIHGGLWKATGYGDATFANIPQPYDNSLEKNNVWEVKYPKIDDLCPSDYSTLWNAIYFATTSSDEDFNLHAAEYFDIPVMVDYYLFVAVTNNFDICGKNVYWAVYDKEQDKKLTVAMWDMDCSMGQNYTDDPLHPEYVRYDYPLLTPNSFIYRLLYLNTNNFQETVRKRYLELRKTFFATASLQQRYIDAYELLNRNGAVLREQQRWSQDTDIAGLPLNLAEELDYIKDWIEHRMTYLDQSFITTSIHSPFIRSTTPNERIYDLNGILNNRRHKILIKNGVKYVR